MSAGGGSTWHQIQDWFTTGTSWTGTPGSPGALHLLVQHLEISAVSLLIACAIAIPMAIGLARLPRGGVIVTTLANSARSVPIVGVLILLAIGSLGVGTTSAVVALVVFAIAPVLTNTYTGIREVDPDVTSAARGMGMSRGQVSRRVELPLAIPLIATGIRVAAVQVWATATIAAIIGSGGLGQLITQGYSVQDYGEVYGGVLVVVVTALVLDGTLAWVQARLARRFGGRQDAPRRGRRQPAEAGVSAVTEA